MVIEMNGYEIKKMLTDVNGTSRILDKHYENTIEGCIPLMIKNDINEYTSSNPDIYQQYFNNNKGNKEVEEKINNIRKVIDISSLPQNITVYKGVSQDMFFKDISLENNCLCYNSFLATSLDPTVAASFCKRIDNGMFLEIHLSMFTKALWLGKISNYPREMEVLLPDHTKFIVTNSHQSLDKHFVLKLKNIQS